MNEGDKSRKRNEEKALGGISNNRDFARLRATKIESDLQLSSARTGFSEAKLNMYLDLLVLIIPQFASLFEGNRKSFDFFDKIIFYFSILV